MPESADVIQQYLNLGAFDELEIALVPVFFGGGRRLFENLHESLPHLRLEVVIDTAAATIYSMFGHELAIASQWAY